MWFSLCTGLLNLDTTDTWGQSIFDGGKGLCNICRIFSSIPSPLPLDASGAVPLPAPPCCNNQKRLPTLPTAFWGPKSPPCENNSYFLLVSACFFLCLKISLKIGKIKGVPTMWNLMEQRDSTLFLHFVLAKCKRKKTLKLIQAGCFRWEESQDMPDFWKSAVVERFLSFIHFVAENIWFLVKDEENRVGLPDSPI